MFMVGLFARWRVRTRWVCRPNSRFAISQYGVWRVDAARPASASGRASYMPFGDQEHKWPSADTTMRFLTAMGKLMLGTPEQAAPFVVNTTLPVSPSAAVSCPAPTNHTSASAATPSLVVEIGGSFMWPPPAFGAHQTSLATGVLPGDSNVEMTIALLDGVPAGQLAGETPTLIATCRPDADE